MEELQSTEILDREIIEEARKKASRILKQAEESIKAQNEKWEKKLNDSLTELEIKYSGQKEHAKKSIMARLSIDKQRLKIEKTEELLNTAVESWYKTLESGKKQELLVNELKKQLEFCNDFLEKEAVSVQTEGLDQNEAESIIKSINESSFLNISISPLTVLNASLSGFPSITLETADVRITASLKNTVDFLLQEKRGELLSALAGCEFLGAP